MSRKKKRIFLFCFIALDILLVALFLFVQSATQESLLKREVYNLTKLDITKDRYNTAIQTRGNYALVEKEIKSYLDEYATHLQDVLSLMENSPLTTLLSANNYIQDGSDFTKSFSYIENRKESFNQEISQLIDSCSEEAIMNHISSSITDPYYVSLYKNLMLDENMTKDFFTSKSLLEEIRVKVNTAFDVSGDVFSFLKQNQKDWKVENGEIQFRTVDLVNQYNSYIEKIKS